MAGSPTASLCLLGPAWTHGGAQLSEANLDALPQQRWPCEVRLRHTAAYGDAASVSRFRSTIFSSGIGEELRELPWLLYPSLRQHHHLLMLGQQRCSKARRSRSPLFRLSAPPPTLSLRATASLTVTGFQ
ncbi:unnamed protein product [Urochloa humidicola]